MSVFSGPQRKSAMREHRARKRAEAIERQRLSDLKATNTTKVSRQKKQRRVKKTKSTPSEELMESIFGKQDES